MTLVGAAVVELNKSLEVRYQTQLHTFQLELEQW